MGWLRTLGYDIFYLLPIRSRVKMVFLEFLVWTPCATLMKKNQNCCKTYKVISDSLLPQLWSVQPVMPCIWALDPCAGHQFRRTDPHNHTTASPIFATAGAPCKTARFPSWTVNINTYLTTSRIGLFHWIVIRHAVVYYSRLFVCVCVCVCVYIIYTRNMKLKEVIG